MVAGLVFDHGGKTVDAFSQGSGSVGPLAGVIDQDSTQLSSIVVDNHCASGFSGATEDRGGVIGGTAVDDRAGNRSDVIAQSASCSVW